MPKTVSKNCKLPKVLAAVRAPMTDMNYSLVSQPYRRRWKLMRSQQQNMSVEQAEM